MKLRSVVISLVVVSFFLGSVAVLAKPAPVLSLKALGRWPDFFLIAQVVKHGTEPFTYFWSIDGGPFEEGESFVELFCLTQTSAAVFAVDADGQESNLETFVCP